MANFMACGVATPNSLGAASSKHHGQRRMRLVWSQSVGGRNSCYHCNNSGGRNCYDRTTLCKLFTHNNQLYGWANHSVGGCKSLLLSARMPSTHHWRRLICLVWSKSVGGTNSYDHYIHCANCLHTTINCMDDRGGTHCTNYLFNYYKLQPLPVFYTHTRHHRPTRKTRRRRMMVVHQLWYIMIVPPPAHQCNEGWN